MDEYVSYLNKLNLANVIHSNKNTNCSWLPEHAVQLSLGEPGDKSVSTQAKLPCTSVGVMLNRDKRLILESDSPQTRDQTLTWIIESSLRFRQPRCMRGASGVVNIQKLQSWQELLPGLSGMWEGAERGRTHDGSGEVRVLAPHGKSELIPVWDFPSSIGRCTGSLGQSVGLHVYVRPWTCFAGSGPLLGIVLKCYFS